MCLSTSKRCVGSCATPTHPSFVHQRAAAAHPARNYGAVWKHGAAEIDGGISTARVLGGAREGELKRERERESERERERARKTSPMIILAHFKN